MPERTSTDTYVVSLLFDKKLIELGKWPDDIYSNLEEWNEIADYEMQRTKAAFLISNLILRILDRDCSSKGKIRVKRLARALANFEQLIMSTGELERKFYRDHLNHMIRVSLLARAIAQKRPFNMTSRDLDKLTLASLFHDVAYPLSKIGQSLKFSMKAIKDCYNVASEALPISEIRFNLNILSSLPIENIAEYKKDLEKLNHGILSSLEFVSYLEQRKGLVQKYKEVIEAIASHSSSSVKKVNSLKERILSILILADELQDWGRPIGHVASFSFIPKIEKFRLVDGELKGEYNTKNISGFSALKQIYGKASSLARVSLPANYSFNLKFSFDDFECVDIQEIEGTLQALFNRCRQLERCLFQPSHFRKLYEDNSIFESEYYGKSIPRKIKLKLSKALAANELSLRSPFRDFRLFFNSAIKELLITASVIGQVRHFEFRSSPTRLIKLHLATKSDGILEGELKSIQNTVVMDLILFLLSEIRFLNICVQKIVKYADKKYPVEMGFEGFPNAKDINKALEETGESELTQTFNLLSRVRDCASNDDIFFFKSQ